MRIPFTLVFIVGLAAPVAAQSTPGTTPVPAVATPTPAAATAPTGDAAARTKAEEPSGYTYHPEGRRDPFVSLLRHAAEAPRGPAGARAPGLAGLGSSEVSLKGTMQGRDGYIAMLLGADNKTYIVRPGDRLLDGAIRAITADSLVILQQVNDPLSPQKQREVRKMLRQTEEAK
jgi:Tfp pilus assembly protein PilP